jgi:hypothetical protein
VTKPEPVIRNCGRGGKGPARVTNFSSTKNREIV